MNIQKLRWTAMMSFHAKAAERYEKGIYLLRDIIAKFYC